MSEVQALEIIKQALNVAVIRGCFETLDSAGVVLQALQVLNAKVQQTVPANNLIGEKDKQNAA